MRWKMMEHHSCYGSQRFCGSWRSLIDSLLDPNMSTIDTNSNFSIVMGDANITQALAPTSWSRFATPQKFHRTS